MLMNKYLGSQSSHHILF